MCWEGECQIYSVKLNVQWRLDFKAATHIRHVSLGSSGYFTAYFTGCSVLIYLIVPNSYLIPKHLILSAWPFWSLWGRYHQEPSSQLITLKSQIFPVKNSNLQSSGLVGLLRKSSVFKTRQFKIWSVFHSSFFTTANLQTSQKPGNHPPLSYLSNTYFVPKQKEARYDPRTTRNEVHIMKITGY